MATIKSTEAIAMALQPDLDHAAVFETSAPTINAALTFLTPA